MSTADYDAAFHKNYFQHREFSFTLKDDIYVRYQSFSTQAELEKEILRMNPYKIDVGAVYSHRPNQHNTVKSGTFQALEKELDFGFRHLLWVYSGRRGVHCWVCDEAARKLSIAGRSAVAEYLSLVKGGDETVRKVVLSDPIHPFIRDSLKEVEKYFPQYALKDQEILGNKKSVDKVLALFAGKKGQHFEKEIMLQYCYPRLDVNVSKGVNHLLKSPFSVHPKTGRISVPIDLNQLDKFDPFDVPTISLICKELDRPRGGEEEEEEEQADNNKEKDGDVDVYVKILDVFLDGVAQSLRGELLRKSDLQKDF
ncbi:hypothetical protein CRUP_012090 [Coryphaenoides rupestris]|nr:hypothetical protein CRUP_012090 [Coryphaenoides rupestris]